MWYRAPELLLGSNHYDTKIDIWSVGCFLVEILMSKPLFQGDNEMRQLDIIFSILGTPTPETWPGVQNLKLYEEAKKKDY